MGERKNRLKELSVTEKKATLKGILIISSIEKIDQTEAAWAYIRQYKRVYGEGIGWEVLMVHLKRRLERIGEKRCKIKLATSLYLRSREHGSH